MQLIIFLTLLFKEPKIVQVVQPTSEQRAIFWRVQFEVSNASIQYLNTQKKLNDVLSKMCSADSKLEIEVSGEPICKTIEKKDK